MIVRQLEKQLNRELDLLCCELQSAYRDRQAVKCDIGQCLPNAVMQSRSGVVRCVVVEESRPCGIR